VGWEQSPARTVAGLASTSLVLDPVVRRLGGGVPESVIASEVLAVDRGETLVDVTVRDASPTRAAEIANAVAEQLRTALDRLRPDAEGTASAALQLTLVSRATRPGAPTPPVAELLQGLVVGGVLGLGIAVLRDRRRARRRPLP
jgi:capsular polysaccharide biosynthesis protein